MHPEHGNGGRPMTAWGEVVDSALRGLRQAMDRWNAGVERAVRAWQEEIGPAVARFLEQAAEAFDEGMAPNWKRLTIPQVLDTIELMRDTGWGLAWTPPHHVLVELLAADGLDARKQVLLDAEPLILIDLRRLLDEVRRPPLYEVARAANEALEVHASGFYWASQALATNALTTTVHEIYGMDRLKDARDTFTRMADEEAGIRELRLAAFLFAIAKVLDTWHPGHPTLEHFNRHLSVHRVGGKSYSQVNSLTSLMLLISFLRETQMVMDLIEQDERADEGAGAAPAEP